MHILYNFMMCYGMQCFSAMLFVFNAMRSVCYGMRNWNEKLYDMTCCGTCIHYAMLWDLSKHDPFTEEFQTLSQKLPKTQSLPLVSSVYIYSLLENYHTKTQFKLCCML